jgi:L-serine dehydratase
MGDSLFSIIGPVMVGPSSSHTAGAVRLGLLARALAGISDAAMPQSVTLSLYNSFAHTYRGHGTDKGLLAGLMGLAVNDEGIRTAEEKAKAAGLHYTLQPRFEANTYPENTVVFEIVRADGSPMRLVGNSIGGGQVAITHLDSFEVTITGETPTLVLVYPDKPGMIWKVTKVIAEVGINIATLQCSRNRRGQDATMVITLDDPIPATALQGLYDVMGKVSLLRCLDALPMV